jgi:hypothetical protein
VAGAMNGHVSGHMHAAEFRRCLVELDTEGITRLWQHVSPHLPQPKTRTEALATLHVARTQTRSIPVKLRYYSHRWCVDNGYPSMLPDRLRPLAERMYPKVVSAVGVSVKSLSKAGEPLALEMQKAMADAVEECYANGQTDPEFVRARMHEAQQRVLKVA